MTSKKQYEGMCVPFEICWDKLGSCEPDPPCALMLEMDATYVQQRYGASPPKKVHSRAIPSCTIAPAVVQGGVRRCLQLAAQQVVPGVPRSRGGSEYRQGIKKMP